MARSRKLRLTAELGSPIAGHGPLQADGILMAVHRGVLGARMISRASPASHVKRIKDLHHPSHWIAWHEDRGICVPLCSAMQGDWKMERADFTQRRDPEDVEVLSRKVTRGSGPDRDKLLPLPLRVAERVWWDVVGNRRNILSLCRNVTAIGSHRRQGYGRVKRWTCEPCDDAQPLARDGWAERHLPAAWCASAERTIEGPVGPPYWYRPFWVEIVPAGTRVGIDADSIIEAHCC